MVWNELTCSEQGQVASPCECGYEPSGPQKWGGISSLAENLLSSQTGLWSTDLVTPCEKIT